MLGQLSGIGIPNSGRRLGIDPTLTVGVPLLCLCDPPECRVIGKRLGFAFQYLVLNSPLLLYLNHVCEMLGAHAHLVRLNVTRIHSSSKKKTHVLVIKTHGCVTFKVDKVG